MGFAKAGDTDSYLARPDIVEEAKRQHQLGSIITICWHAVPPTADEPVTFRPATGKVAPESLASVQGQLLDQQFKDLLTPGTELHKRWAAQVDSVAFYLKKLQEARVPILWRPYHEMNGNWFWWGGRTGEYSTSALYRQLFDRFVHHHKLDNLIWVWSVDRPQQPNMYFSKYYPGNEYLDVLALDVYGRDFKQVYYDSLLALSKGKPMVLGEVGNPPTLDILDKQPNWAFYVTWAGMVRNTSKKEYNVLMADPSVLNKENAVYMEIIAPFRAACGLPPLEKFGEVEGRPDFTGTWIFNEDQSTLDNIGVSFLPYKLTVNQNNNLLVIQKTFIVEWGDDRILVDTLTLDGEENVTMADFGNLPQVMKASWSENADTLMIEIKVTFNHDGQASEMITRENWILQESGKVLAIKSCSKSAWGESNITLIFDKR
jgi:mannan endo-1,4-beta-mannosidase